MKTIRAIVAEDEPILAQTLVQTLSRVWPELEVAAIAAHGAQTVEEALAHQPEVLFLDIKMPGMSGLDAAHALAEEWPHGAPFPLVVFVTAYDEYALDAFEHAAVDYVLKPVSDARLEKTVARLKDRLARQAPGAALDDMLGQLRSLLPGLPAAAPGERLSMIRAGLGNEVRMIPVADVVYFEAADKYVNVVTREGEAAIRTSLRDLLAQLDTAQFWQIHRGTVVNSACVETAVRDDAGKMTLKLRGMARTLPVSRVFQHLFRQM